MPFVCADFSQNAVCELGSGPEVSPRFQRKHDKSNTRNCTAPKILHENQASKSDSVSLDKNTRSDVLSNCPLVSGFAFPKGLSFLKFIVCTR